MARALWLVCTCSRTACSPGPLAPEVCARVTVIGATTDVGRLPETNVESVAMRPVLVPYSELEARRIALYMAEKTLLRP